MKLWSRGLGRRELEMDFRYYKIMRGADGKSVQVIGKVLKPVNWEFRIVFTEEDVAGLIKVAMNLKFIKLVLKNLPKYFSYLSKKSDFSLENSSEEKILSVCSQMLGEEYNNNNTAKRNEIQVQTEPA